MSKPQSHTVEILKNKESAIIEDWIAELRKTLPAEGKLSSEELQSQAREIHKLLSEAVRGNALDLDATSSGPLRSFLESISRTRSSCRRKTSRSGCS